MKTTLLGLGATAAAITAAQAGRNEGKVVAVRENRHPRLGNDRRYSGASSRHAVSTPTMCDLSIGDTEPQLGDLYKTRSANRCLLVGIFIPKGLHTLLRAAF